MRTIANGNDVPTDHYGVAISAVASYDVTSLTIASPSTAVSANLSGKSKGLLIQADGDVYVHVDPCEDAPGGDATDQDFVVYAYQAFSLPIVNASRVSVLNVAGTTTNTVRVVELL